MIPDPTARRRGVTLEIVSTVAIVIAAGAVVWATFRPAPIASTANPPAPSRPAVKVPANPLSLEGAATRGSQSARIALVEFSEFQCPFCARFVSETLPSLDRAYVISGRVLMAFRHLPLENTHPLAFGASEIAACGLAAGRFWEVHDAFFAQPKVGQASDYLDRARRAGLDTRALSRCMTAHSTADQVRADMTMAASLGVKSTPTFFVGEHVDGAVRVLDVIQGARPLADFEKAIAAAERSVTGVGDKR